LATFHLQIHFGQTTTKSLYNRRRLRYNWFMYDLILFDLDGTLVNSQRGIEFCLRHVFDRHGVTFTGDITKFIGPPFVRSFPQFLGTDERKTELMISDYRDLYATTGVYQTTLFRGITDLLSSLKNSGKAVALATTKPRHFAEVILKHKRIYKYFDFVSGTEPDGSLTDKVDVLNNAFSHLPFSHEQSVLIGDTIYDALGAKEVGLDCIGVTYGYGTKDELTSCGVKQIATSPREVKKILLGQ